MKSKLKLVIYNIIGLGIFLLIDYSIANGEYIFHKSLRKAFILLFLFNIMEFIIRRTGLFNDNENK